jgi:uncharacterized protein (DUF2249 family)
MTELHLTHECTCCEHDAEMPVLDARLLPHAIRHASIFGALDSLASGGGLILIAPHDPLPLLAQVQERFGDSFSVSYVERGPEWKLRLVRV